MVVIMCMDGCYYTYLSSRFLLVREQKPRTRTAGPVVPQCVVSPHNPFLPQHCRVHEERREKVSEDEVGIPLAFDYG